MLRIGTSLLLIACQGTMLIAAPLSICTCSAGKTCLDLGPVACGCCPSSEDNQHEPSPCDCDHQPLVDDAQLVNRSGMDAWGDLLAATVSNHGAAIDVPVSAMTAHSSAWDLESSHTPLGDLKAVCLRC
jgi:hypothetical protein